VEIYYQGNRENTSCLYSYAKSPPRSVSWRGRISYLWFPMNKIRRVATHGTLRTSNGARRYLATLLSAVQSACANQPRVADRFQSAKVPLVGWSGMPPSAWV